MQDTPSHILVKNTSVSSRIASIDALRGFIMLAMIFVNDLAIIKGHIVPDWMVHFSDRAKGSGMTFVDLVLPAFIFIVGMSIPFSMRASQRKQKTRIQISIHIITRTLSLLLLGVMLVNGWPSSIKMGWSSAVWETLMGVSAIFAFCEISPPNMTSSKQKACLIMTHALHIIGFAGLGILAYLYVGQQGQHILTLSPPHIYTSWWGILGIIGWAYLIASIIYLVFQNNRMALLGCIICLLALFSASQSEVFKAVWWIQTINHYINIGATLGSQPAIAVAGMLLATILMTPDTKAVRTRIQFTLGFILVLIIAAILLNNLYGISKNQATPSWALWACAVTASLWLFFYIICDVKPIKWIANPLTMAGHNVLLAYLLSAIYFSFLINIGLGDGYRSIGLMGITYAVLRAISMSIILVYCTVKLNHLGFKLKL